MMKKKNKMLICSVVLNFILLALFFNCYLYLEEQKQVSNDLCLLTNSLTDVSNKCTGMLNKNYPDIELPVLIKLNCTPRFQELR